MYEQVYHGFLLVCMIVLGALIMLCLLRAILGPRLADRVVAVNMIGTMTITEIAMFALYLRENYLYDVCLIYAMISFLAVVVLTKIYGGAYQERQIKGTPDLQVAWVQLIAGGILIVTGLLTMCAAVLGVFRFHYVLNRMHAAAMGDSLGILFIILGLMILSGFQMGTLKLLLIVIFFWLAGPVSSHMIGKLEVLINEHLKEECEVSKDGDI